MIINSPLNWQVHYEYSRHGLGMIFSHNQNWRTSTLPFSLSLAQRVNTGVSFDTPSGGIAERQRWASRGFQGYGPRIQYPNRGMDGLMPNTGVSGLGCGCGCGGHGDCGGNGNGFLSFLICAGGAAAALYLLRGRNGL